MSKLVRLGGSLINYPRDLARLCEELSLVGEGFYVVPGGGVFADVVRVACERFKLSDELAHWMAILGMEQYAFMLSGLLRGSVLVGDVASARSSLSEGRIPIILPYLLLRGSKRSIPHSWDVTSDSISVYIADDLGADMVILVKDVDGVFDHEGRLMEKLHSRDLQKVSPGCVDAHLKVAVERTGLSCLVINGRYPNRVVEAIRRGKAKGTIILPEPR